MAVSVSVRGQTVIPAEIRKKYKIFPQSKVEFIDTGKEIILVPVQKNSFKNSFGILKGVSTMDLVSERRREREHETRKTK